MRFEMNASLIILSAALMASVVSVAAPIPSPIFSDDAVLQRGVPVPVWGAASPGEKVTVAYRGKSVEATADPSGFWKAELPPLTAGPGEDFVVSGASIFRVSNVAVGDVWLCSGQSNMEWPVEKSDDFAQAQSEGQQPWLRELKVQHLAAEKPQTSFVGKWQVCTPATVGGFSAVAYHFVRQFYPDGSVPVGILNLSYGGTTIEAWMSPEALASAKSGPAVLARWSELAKEYPAAQAKYDAELPAWEARRDAAKAAGKKFTEKLPVKPRGRPGHFTQPSALFHGMTAPVAGFPVKGFIWYQGESNVLRPEEYADLLASHIQDTRKRWNAPELPAFIVQLPNFGERKLPGHMWAKLRGAQAEVAETVPHTDLAVTIDIGNERDKHPRNKTELGRRLARLAKRSVLKEKVPAIAPLAKSARLDGASVEITFESQGADLVLRGAPGEKLAFELAGPDGIFHPATAVVTAPDAVSLRAAEVKQPVHARYLAYDAPKPLLFTTDGVPAAPFALNLAEVKQ
jgi:sialate O-acetylesterase